MIISYEQAPHRPLIGEIGPTLPVDPVHPGLVRQLTETSIDTYMVTLIITPDGNWFYVELPGGQINATVWAFLVQGDPRTYGRVIFPRPDGCEGAFEWDPQTGPARDLENYGIEELVVWARNALLDHAQEAQTDPGVE
jgi:hypothetical protein